MTDPSPPRSRPRWEVDARALRLWVISGLATTYLIAWWSFAPAPTAVTAAAEPDPPPTALAPTTVWWHELPPADRPAVALPPGWTVATGTPTTARPSVAPTAPRARPTRRRVRTRSS